VLSMKEAMLVIQVKTISNLTIHLPTKLPTKD